MFTHDLSEKIISELKDIFLELYKTIGQVSPKVASVEELDNAIQI
jgi:hypothetical protein